MKTATIIYEGAADVPLETLEARTPLEVARCAYANMLAEAGCCGLLAPVQDGLDARNEVTLAVLCGADVDTALGLQRGPLEALALGADLSRYRYAYRGNLVTLDADLLTDAHVPGVSEEETRSLAATLQDAHDPASLRFEVMGPGRVVVLVGEGEAYGAPGYPPTLMQGEDYGRYFPPGKEGDWLRSIVRRSADALAGHAVNEVRVDLGENPANGLWLWGGGDVLAAGSIDLQLPGPAALMSQSAMAQGFAQACGMQVIPLHAPWLAAGNEAAFRVAPLVSVLQECDQLFVYIEAPAEGGRYGTPEKKVRALERMDRYLLGPLVSVLEAYRPYRICLTADGVVSSMDHHPTSGSVPLVVAGEGVDADDVMQWNEVVASHGGLGTLKPSQVRELLARA